MMTKEEQDALVEREERRVEQAARQLRKLFSLIPDSAESICGLIEALYLSSSTSSSQNGHERPRSQS